MSQSYSIGSGRTASQCDHITNQRGFMKVEGAQEAYIEKKEKLLSAIHDSKSILNDLRKFLKESWVVRYPQVAEQTLASESLRQRPRTSRHSLSFVDDPTFQTDVVVSPGKQGLTKSISLPAVSEMDGQEASIGSVPPLTDSIDFNVLRLDLKLGAHNSSTSPTSLVSQLEKHSIAKLIDERIRTSLNHLDKLCLRVEDTSSKVLVTGDLNAGKSTFVNAILGRSIMPVDQQPCTTAFCEVHDAAENRGKEEVHIIKEGVNYSLDDESTFSRASIAKLGNIISDNENAKQVLKVYLSDPRSPAQTLLYNGVVDISLIDAPGLNRDSLKTTALFTRQEEIDVVVFVVSAENHFTLSAKEFLTNASNDKAYLFIVVNKFDGIRDKSKCRRLILEQIKQLSPRTYEDAEDLVHFVDSATSIDTSDTDPSFANLEFALRSFVLTKRTKSKLQPASTYLSRLLSDVDFLVSANAIVARSEVDRARNDLETARPVLDKLHASREMLSEDLELIEEEGANKAAAHAKTSLNDALDRVERGQSTVRLPTYPGVFGVWGWASEVRRTLLASLDLAVKVTEDDARVITSSGVNQILQLADQHLPEGFERSKRVFIPEAMFSVRGNGRVTVVAGGTQGLGIGLIRRSDLLETTFFDLFDVRHQISEYLDDEGYTKFEPGSTTALGMASLGLGALTVVGGKALGMRVLIEGALRIGHWMADESTRKWFAPVAGAFTIGLTGYVILELPKSVPRTIGRRIKYSLTKDSEEKGEKWVELHAGRIQRETRKVLRLASWDQKETFRSATEASEKTVRDAEEMEKKARKAVELFGEVQSRSGQVIELIREESQVQAF